MCKNNSSMIQEHRSGQTPRLVGRSPKPLFFFFFLFGFLLLLLSIFSILRRFFPFPYRHLFFVFLSSFELRVELLEHDLSGSLEFSSKSGRLVSSAFSVDEFGENEVSESDTRLKETRSR